MEPKKLLALICGIAVVAAVALALIMSNGCEGGPCNGRKCRETLRLSGTPAQMDSIFRRDNPSQAKAVKVFVECSASMDGYVAGNSEFKTTLHNLINQTAAALLPAGTTARFNYINSKVIPLKDITLREFTRAMSPASFRLQSELAGGDRSQSDLMAVIETAMQQTADGEVTILVSDCVFSPEKASDLDKALDQQRTDMTAAIRKRAKGDPGFAVMAVRFTSSFKGIYYTKTDAMVAVNGQRPYYVWFFGNQSLIAEARRAIESEIKTQKAKTYVGAPGYAYAPYKTLKATHPYHFENAKANFNGFRTFSFVADVSIFPASHKYLFDSEENYETNKEKYTLEKIEEYEGDGGSPYNAKFVVKALGPKNDLLTPGVVEVRLNNPSSKVPSWVKESDDPLGEDYDHGYDPKLQRTFGLRSLIEGAAACYQQPYWATYRVKIN